MAETITLTTPPIPSVAVDYRVVYLELDWEAQRIVVRLLGSDGSQVGHNYRGTTALTLMRALNTANLTLKSLHRRIIERMIADGVITGPISGVPD